MHVKDCRLTGRPATAWYMSADGKHLGGKLLRSDSGPGAGTRNEDALFDVPTAEGRKCIAFSPLQLTGILCRIRRSRITAENKYR
jgi:hypothetical protein